MIDWDKLWGTVIFLLWMIVFIAFIILSLTVSWWFAAGWGLMLLIWCALTVAYTKP